MPTSEVITQLTEIGAGDEAAVPPVLGEPDVAWSLLQGDKASWTDAAVAMPEERLRFLIRGLVLYSTVRGPAALGGSVSPVISLFSVYAKRFPESEPSLTQWSLQIE